MSALMICQSPLHARTDDLPITAAYQDGYLEHRDRGGEIRKGRKKERKKEREREKECGINKERERE